MKLQSVDYYGFCIFVAGVLVIEEISKYLSVAHL